ncbi:MAG TPA: hypothetical protein VF266_02245 [Thermoanaerobaculia bacterium]
MKRTALLLIMLVLLSCRRESPSEPSRDDAFATTTDFEPAIRISPDPVVIGVGQEVTVTATLTFTDGYAIPVPLQTSNSAVATMVTRSFPPNQKTASLTVRGVAPGECRIDYALIVFGRGHIGTAGRVTVIEGHGTPRPVTPVKEITMTPNPVVLRPGQTERVRVTLARAADSDIVFSADPRGVVQAEGRIARGANSGTVTVQALAVGKANVMAGPRIAGRAIVEAPAAPAPPSRRRASRS